MGDSTTQLRVGSTDVVIDSHNPINNNTLPKSPTGANTRTIDCLSKFFYMFCYIMTGRDDQYLQIYDGSCRKLAYNRFAPRELYNISLVDRKSYELCRAKLFSWRNLYNKYKYYFAESFHNVVTQSLRFKEKRILVSKYMNMFAPIHHDLLGPCLIDHHTFKDNDTEYAVGLYGLTLWFTRPSSFKIHICIETARNFVTVYHNNYTADDFIFENDMWVVNCFMWRSNPITIFMQNLSRICLTVSNTTNEMPIWVVTQFGYAPIFQEYDMMDIAVSNGCDVYVVNSESIVKVLSTSYDAWRWQNVSNTKSNGNVISDDEQTQSYYAIKFITPIGIIISKSLSLMFLQHVKNGGVTAYTPRMICSGTFMSSTPDYYKWYMVTSNGYKRSTYEEMAMPTMGEKITHDIHNFISTVTALQH